MSNEALAVAVQKGDADALGQLWQQVQGYALFIVKKYKPKPYAEREDYMQTAFLGVRSAALAYDPARGSFLTVADWYIRKACSAFYHWNRCGEVQTISYDVPMNEEDPDGGDFRDSFPDETLRDPLEDLAAADLVRDVRAAVDELTPRQQAVIDARYYQGQPLEAVSRIQGVSAERIRQIERKALQHLREDPRLAAYKRVVYPVQGVGFRLWSETGESAVERAAIKNIDRALRAELRAFERHVRESIEKGYYSPEVGEMVIENYKRQRGMLSGVQKAACECFID